MAGRVQHEVVDAHEGVVPVGVCGRDGPVAALTKRLPEAWIADQLVNRGHQAVGPWGPESSVVAIVQQPAPMDIVEGDDRGSARHELEGQIRGMVRYGEGEPDVAAPIEVGGGAGPYQRRRS